MNFTATQTPSTLENERETLMSRVDLDVRMVSAIAGDRAMNAREQHILERLMNERGEGIYSDILYALTHRSFPARQAKHLWDEIGAHRQAMKQTLGRDVGIPVATHDYLTNIANLMKSVTVIEESKMASLTNVATRDGLTGLFDQATFKYRLKEELERQVRYGGALSLLMFDLDHFKKLNDTYGHAEGDRVLKGVADVIRSQVRMLDVAARYGGEEFAVILPTVDTAGALLFANRLREAIFKAFESEEYTVSMSGGICTNLETGDKSADELIKVADKGLYKAKEAGRNRIEMAE